MALAASHHFWYRWHAHTRAKAEAARCGGIYRTGTGNEPVRAWLLTLPIAERQAVGRDIRKVEYGWPLGMPTCDALGQGLWEIRTTLQNRIARVFFCLVGNRVVLLHAIIKKSRTAPKAELETARARKSDLEARLRHLAA